MRNVFCKDGKRGAAAQQKMLMRQPQRLRSPQRYSFLFLSVNLPPASQSIFVIEWDSQTVVNLPAH